MDCIRTMKKRMIAACGHYGSGKTEFSVSLAMRLAAAKSPPWPRLAMVDLDIVNPYFRSRERMATLREAGVQTYGGFGGLEITAEVPAIDPAIRAPLQDPGCRVVIDLGGNDSGARVMHQFAEDMPPGDTLLLAVINASRPDTATTEGALEQIAAIERELGRTVDGLVNNTHLLMETTPEVIAQGHTLCENIYKSTGKQLYCDCYPAPLMDREQLRGIGEYLMPIGLYMRPSWLDK